MDLNEVRQRIDGVDNQLIVLFEQRMKIAQDVAAAKIEMGIPVYDPARERAKLLNIAGKVPEEHREQIVSLFSLIMSMNKAEQQKIVHEHDGSSPAANARATYLPADTPFPSTATVACQGVEGAYSQIAACRLFKVPGISFFDTFEGVFRAVQEGFCEYGVLPIENSTAGSVNAVYDLLAKYRFSIVRSLRLKIDHNLLAKPGTKLENVSEVFSHQQALSQCKEYLEQLGVKPTVVENTAMAAKMVRDSGRDDVAALSSRSCASLYGLTMLDTDVQDSKNNYTRFVVISAKPQVFSGATRTSLMLTTSNDPGSLYRVLEHIYALGINLVKLESRPIPGRDYEFVFYFDLDCPVGSTSLDRLLDSLDTVCERFTYFGSYTEVL